MKQIGIKPFHGSSYELTYELPHPRGGKLQKFTNLVGVIPGRDRSLPPILLGAHYDSVIDAPSVDDNATSVAHNIVLAGHYALQPLERDLIIAFFDAEEPPFFLGRTMGSRRFVRGLLQGHRLRRGDYYGSCRTRRHRRRLAHPGAGEKPDAPPEKTDGGDGS